MPRATGRDIAELFGHAPDDITSAARSLWHLGACPFIKGQCTKINHDQTITYGTCSVQSKSAEIIICPNRLYANSYATIRAVATDAFGGTAEFCSFGEYIDKRTVSADLVVALGQNSGKEVKLGSSLSMDWVLAHIASNKLVEYVGIEVQSIDITGNYRDCWHGYKELENNASMTIPSSAHGLNWANFHKRLIPQLIRKGLVYSKSSLVKSGMYFIVPDEVCRKFEKLLGEIDCIAKPTYSSVTVYTYALGEPVAHGQMRDLVEVRKLRFHLDDLIKNFVSGTMLPSGEDLDNSIRKILGIA
jgi:hypothetical protein